MPLAEVGPRDAEAWIALTSRAIDPHPFLDPRYLLPSVRHREQARDMGIVLVEDGADLLGVIGVTRESRIGGLPIATASTGGAFMTRWAGRHHPLVDENRAPEVIETLLTGMRGHPVPGLLELSRFPSEGPLADALRQAAAAARTPLLERVREQRVIARPWPPIENSSPGDPSIEAITLALPHRSSSTMRKLRREARTLSSAAGAPLVVRDRSADPQASADFLDLEAAGWKGGADRGGEGFRRTGHADWFLEVTAAFRDSGLLAMHELSAGDETLHLAVNLRSPRAEFGFVDTFSPPYAQHRAGVIGRVAELNRILARPDTEYFDPCLAPQFAESEKLYPDARTQSNIVVAHGGASARAMLRALPIARSARDWLRSRRGSE